MNCPNCGAALEPIPNRSHLRCPYCQTIQFPESAGEGIVPLDRDYEYDCPCCERRLESAALDGESTGYCPHCRGVLVESDDFARVIARRRETGALRNQRIEPIDPAEFRRAVRCPRCGRKMDTHTYGGGGNAVIDSCYHCRLVWLDAGELTVLGRFPGRSPAPVPVEPDADR